MEYFIYLFIAIFIGICGSITAAMLNFGMQDGMLLDWYRKFLEKLPKRLAKPLGLCPWCTAPHPSWITTALILVFLGNAHIIAVIGFSYLSWLSAWAFLAFNYNTLVERNKNPLDVFRAFYDTFIDGWSVGAYPAADKEYVLGFMSELNDDEKTQFFKALRTIVLAQDIKPNNYNSSKETNTNKDFVILNELEHKNKVIFKELDKTPQKRNRKCSTCNKKPNQDITNAPSTQDMDTNQN